jgi:hypothetical protein
MSNSNRTLKIYYKGLFGSPEENSISLDETQLANIPHVSAEENDLLKAPYSEDEVNKAIFQMEHNKASGLDGFLAEFYQTFLGDYQGRPSTDVWCFTRWTVRIILSKFR